MDSQQRAVDSLRFVVQTCNAALEDIPQEPTDHPIHVLHNDLLSILALLYSAVTKTSLTLKPAKPAYSAALEPLKSLHTHTSALFHCASHFIPATHGATLVREIHFLVADAIEAIRALAQCFLDIESSDVRVDTGKAGDEYMVRTATAHTVLKRNVSASNLLAVRKRWLDDGGSLDDGYREVGEIIDNSDEGDDFDDGWDELGLGKSEQLTPEELERTKKVHGVLRLVQVLHKRILRDILSQTSGGPDLATLDNLASDSRALLCASDELVAALYSPQNADKIRAELASFRNVLVNLRSSLNPIESELERLLLDSGGSTRNWFDTAFVQVFKALDVLLPQPE